MKNEVINLLKKEVELSKKEIENLIEIPPNSEMGDFAFPCFVLSKTLKQQPHEIAKDLRKKINPTDEIESVVVNGPYLNFFVNKKLFSENLINEILEQKEKFGSKKFNLKGMIEFPSPNTNKPLHLGHLRNMAIGESLARIAEFYGEEVIRANLNNDRGIHICKSMVAYQKFGKNKTPGKTKSDHFVGEFYVKFNKKSKINKKLEDDAKECLRKWEAGDKETIALWKKMNKWALDGFRETYKLFKIKHDRNYYESEIYNYGKEIVAEGIKKRIFKKQKDGSVIINLKKENLGEKILLRADGTSVYITQDLYLAKLKDKEFDLDWSIYVVGNEQDYHFNVLFAILKKLGYDLELKHLSYGMVNLPEGKMKSREGTVVDADDLIKNVQNLVKKELTSRTKLSKKELESRSLKIALAAIKYFLLKVDIKKNMLFNPKESINFEGDTGPYLLYSYARASSILRRVTQAHTGSSKIQTKAKPRPAKTEIKNFEKQEFELAKKLSQFPEVVLSAYKNYNPSLIANYSYELAKTFNEFYHACPVINSENQNFRLNLVKSFRIVLKNSLNLLGIETLEEM